MKNNTLKITAVAISAAFLSTVVNTSQAAAPLISFSNGTVADADDVNANFIELETRINTISLTPGPAGTDGADGAQGPMGIPGMPGANGAQGPMGPQGIPGPNGTNGINGAQGPAGPAGPAGANGTDGADGAQGPIGPQGIPGVNGSNGLNGLDGADGIDGAQGPVGPAGPAGADGIDGTNGTGITFQSWADFDGSVGWSVKTYIVMHSQGSWDKEVLTFTRTPTNATTGTISRALERTLTGAVVKYFVNEYSYDTAGDLTLTQRKNYANDTTTLLDTRTISPGLRVRHDAMGIGINWASASTITKVFEDASPTEIDFAVDSRSLLAVEDITVQGVVYTGCHKILSNRSADGIGGHNQKISWFCPGGVGLVKQFHVRDDSTISWMREFDQSQSTAIP